MLIIVYLSAKSLFHERLFNRNYNKKENKIVEGKVLSLNLRVHQAGDFFGLHLKISLHCLFIYFSIQVFCLTFGEPGGKTIGNI